MTSQKLKLRCLLVWLGIFVMVQGRVGFAQTGLFEKAAEKFEYFNFFWQHASLSPRPAQLTAGPRNEPPKAGWLRGYGIELAFTLDSTAKLSGIPIRVDLGVGYSQLVGFQSTDSSMEFGGALRELPSVTVYVTQLEQAIAPYVGVRTGLVGLHQASFFDQDVSGKKQTQYAVAGQTFQYGLVGGLIANVKIAEIFVEGARMYRTFAGLQYTAKDNQLPLRLPTSLNASMWSLSFGIQFRKGPDKQK